MTSQLLGYEGGRIHPESGLAFLHFRSAGEAAAARTLLHGKPMQQLTGERRARHCRGGLCWGGRP